MKKEFHIISTGVSIITNAQKNNVIPQDKKIRDEEYWRELLDNPSEIQKLKSFVEKDPHKNSAELNTFLRVVEDKDPSNIEIYLFGTKTYSNELCRRILELYLRELGYKLYTPYEISGYFWEAKYYDENYAKDEFKKGISELLDRLIHIAQKKKKEGYEIYFNPTGGLKAHVITTALAGYLVDAQIYYMNEEFNETVFLPKLFYLPKGKEIEILNKLNSSSIISGKETKDLYSSYQNEIERLIVYNLITTETNESGEIFKIKITYKGKLILEELKQNT